MYSIMEENDGIWKDFPSLCLYDKLKPDKKGESIGL